MSAAWTVSQYTLEDRHNNVHASITHYDRRHEEEEGDWHLAVASDRVAVTDLTGTWWPSHQLAREAVDARIREHQERQDLAAIEAAVDALGIPGGTR